MFSKNQQKLSGLLRQISVKEIHLTPIRNKATAAAGQIDPETDIKSYDEVPGPKRFFQVLANTIEGFKYIGKGHIILEEKHKRYGPIFKENLVGMNFIQICDVKDIEHMLRNDHKYPSRIVVDAWSQWRENAKESYGILIQNDGPEWKRMRVLLDKKMMRPHHVSTYTEDFNNVITDFMERLNNVRATEGNGIRVPNLDQELFHWSLETIGTVIYERRLGGLDNDRPLQMTDFINAVQNIFRTTEQIFAVPFWLAKYIRPTAYKKHVHAWETVFSIGKKLIDEKTSELQTKLEKGEEVDGFLSSLLASKSLSQSEVYANISELMLGAVDTTSNTMQWIIYELARNPEVQEKLRQEIADVTQGAIPDQDALQNMPYLRGVIKEGLRLYPVAGVVSRTLREDLVLAGYLIPKGTLILASSLLTGRNPDIFEDPLAFKPERWLRSEKQAEKLHTFGWLPFGFGVRMCIGRRVAELEMHLLTARLIQKFRLEPLDDQVLNIVTRGIFVPEKSVDVKFNEI